MRKQVFLHLLIPYLLDIIPPLTAQEAFCEICQKHALAPNEVSKRTLRVRQLGSNGSGGAGVGGKWGREDGTH